MKYTLTLIALILATALVGGGCRPGDHEEDPLANGIALMQTGANEAARDALIAAAALYTNSVTAHCNLGLVYWKLGDHTAAIASLTRASDLSDTDVRPLELLAHVLIEAGNEQGAHKVLANVEEPTATTLALMALAAQRAGSSDLARSYLGRALQLNEAYAPAIYNLALLCRDTYAAPREALSYYKRFQALAPNNWRAAESPQAFINVGNAEAADATEPRKAETVEPVAPPPAEPEPGEAPPVETPASNPATDEPAVEALLSSASAELADGNVDVALLTLKQAVEDHPGNADAIWALIQLYDTHLGNQERATEMHKRFSAIFPNDSRALEPEPTPAPPPAEALGDTLFRKGLEHYAKEAWGEAIASYQAALEADPTSSRAAYNLGLAFKANGDLDRAAKAFVVALELQKDMPKALYMLGLTEIQRGRNPSALAHLNRLIRVQPDFDKAHYLLGRIWREEGRPDMVRIHFERFLHLTPTGSSADSVRRWLEQNQGGAQE
ncbi:MAG: tetratricopeptide repeat protein [Verrucomicrobia bacterium]|nr:tetratricopeptide repeat protein [Verrucomicrobiota bacterium]